VGKLGRVKFALHASIVMLLRSEVEDIPYAY